MARVPGATLTRTNNPKISKNGHALVHVAHTQVQRSNLDTRFPRFFDVYWRLVALCNLLNYFHTSSFVILSFLHQHPDSIPILLTHNRGQCLTTNLYMTF